MGYGSSNLGSASIPNTERPEKVDPLPIRPGLFGSLLLPWFPTSLSELLWLLSPIQTYECVFELFSVLGGFSVHQE